MFGRLSPMSASSLDDQMSQLSGRRCSHSGVLIRRAHIIASLLAVVIGSVAVGFIVSNLFVAVAIAVVLGAATSPFLDRRVLAVADGDLVQASCGLFGRKPTRLLPPLSARELAERPFGPNGNFALSISGKIFVLQGRSDDFARGYRAVKRSVQ